MADDLIQRLIAELSKDGKPVGFMQCNKCGPVSAFHSNFVMLYLSVLLLR